MIVFILSTCNDSNKNHTVNAYQSSVFGSRKHHFTATTKRDPLLFRTPSLFQSKSSNRSTNHLPQATIIDLFDTTATTHHRDKSNNVLSKFISLFRVQRLKWYFQHQQQQFWNLHRHCKNMFLPILFSLILCFSILSSAWAVSGGRMGGSFGKSSSSSSSSSSYSYSRPSQLSRPYYSNNSPRVSRPRSQSYYLDDDDSDDDSPHYRSRTSSSSDVEEESTASDAAVLIGGALSMAMNDLRFRYKYRKRKDNNNDHENHRSSKTSALGGGATVVSLTVALHVPQRDDADNILTKLHRLSQSARTDTRRGLQQLVSTGKSSKREKERECVLVVGGRIY